MNEPSAKWYHGHISQEEAERLVKAHGPEDTGRFLVRAKDVSRGEFILSVMFNKRPVHLPITHDHVLQKWQANQHSYGPGNSIEELIETLKTPLATQKGFLVRLEEEVHRTAARSTSPQPPPAAAASPPSTAAASPPSAAGPSAASPGSSSSGSPDRPAILIEGAAAGSSTDHDSHGHHHHSDHSRDSSLSPMALQRGPSYEDLAHTEQKVIRSALAEAHAEHELAERAINALERKEREIQEIRDEAERRRLSQAHVLEAEQERLAAAEARIRELEEKLANAEQPQSAASDSREVAVTSPPAIAVQRPSLQINHGGSISRHSPKHEMWNHWELSSSPGPAMPLPPWKQGILNARKRVEAKRQRERMEQAKRDAALGPLPIKINAKGMAEADGTYNEIFTAIPMKNFPEPDIGQVVCVEDSMTLEDLSRVFIANGFSSAPVERTATGTQPKWPDAFAGSVTQADLVLFALENLQSGPLFDMQQQIGVSQRVRTTRVAAITKRFSEKKPFPAVRASRETLLDTVLLLAHPGVGRVAVLDGDTVINWVTRVSIVEIINDNVDRFVGLMQRSLKELGLVVGGREMVTVDVGSTLLEAMYMLRDRGVVAVPVLGDQQHVLGTVTLRDLRDLLYNPKTMQLLAQPLTQFVKQRIHTVEAITCTMDTSLEDVISKLATNKTHCIFVLDEWKHLISMVSLGDILRILAREPHSGYVENLLHST